MGDVLSIAMPTVSAACDTSYPNWNKGSYVIHLLLAKTSIGGALKKMKDTKRESIIMIVNNRVS